MLLYLSSYPLLFCLVNHFHLLCFCMIFCKVSEIVVYEIIGNCKILKVVHFMEEKKLNLYDWNTFPLSFSIFLSRLFFFVRKNFIRLLSSLFLSYHRLYFTSLCPYCI